MKIAVPPAAVQAKSRSKVRELMNSTGNTRRAVVVKIVQVCWIPRMMNRTPEHTKRPMILPEFQSQVMPPKLMAITPDVKAPMVKTAPI